MTIRKANTALVRLGVLLAQNEVSERDAKLAMELAASALAFANDWHDGIELKLYNYGRTSFERAAATLGVARVVGGAA